MSKVHFLKKMAAALIIVLIACVACKDDKPVDDIVKVTKITLNKTGLNLAPGESKTLSVSTIEPANADNKEVIWSSNPTGWVNEEGKVTVPATATIGQTTTIIATAKDGGGAEATCTVTVVAEPEPGLVKSASVGTQVGILTAGVAGAVTFPVTTTNITNGAYTATVANLPTGVAISGNITISGNSGTLTLAGNVSTVAGVTSTLMLTIDNTQSATFTLTVSSSNPVGNGDGTAANPFVVATVADLKKVGTETGIGKWTLTAHYLQIANIDLSSIANWTPIGTHGSPFRGTYDGGGKTINGLKIVIETSDFGQGLFGRIYGGTVKNITLVDVSIKGGYCVGAVAGALDYSGIIQNCSVNGEVSGRSNINGTSSTGGVVGDIDGDAVVQGCSFTGSINSVTGYGYGFGGVAGTISSGTTVQNCYATGSISGDSGVGGVAGGNDGMLKYCYATASVSGNSSVGGVAGNNVYNGTVQNCYATGNVIGGLDGSTTGIRIGGVVGGNYNKVLNCYATGNVTGEYRVGGITGEEVIGGTIVQNCVALNKGITATENTTSIGRVSGRPYSGGSTLSNNYGRSNMTIFTNGVYTPSKTTGGKDGADVAAVDYNGANSGTWWSSTAGFPSDVWDFTANKLPILKNVRSIQNPTVQ